MESPKFAFRLSLSKPKRPAGPKKVGGIVKGVAFKDDNDEWRIKVALVNKDENDKTVTSYLILPFTEKSFDLEGKENIFSLTPDKHGRYIRFIRSKEHAKTFPGLREQYCSICRNYVYKGYIVEVDGKKHFDMRECVTIAGHENDKYRFL